MMTGRLPVRVGLGDGVLTASAIGGLQTNETTMAESLSKLGYETAMFGKWQYAHSLTPAASQPLLPLTHCPDNNYCK